MMSMVEDRARAAGLRGFIQDMVGNWAGPGWDAERQGFHEQLTLQLEPAGPAHRRLHLTARLLFVLSCAPAIAGASVPAGTIDAVFRLLAERFRDRDHGGFCFTLDLDGNPLDRRKDLYGHAFVLFALAAYGSVSGDAAAWALARDAHAVLERHLRMDGGWFAAGAAADWSGCDAALVQNPNMHLLEAYLALEAADPTGGWAVQADRLVAVFHDHLYDPSQFVLGEFYDAAGAPHPETGDQVEPGHQFEWSWLLHAHAAARGIAPPAASGALIDRAQAIGVDPVHGGIWDRISRDGAVLAQTKRIWPVCEAIKAYAARRRVTGAAADLARMRDWLDFLGDRYLRPAGCWTETLERDLTPAPGHMPGTTPYHLLMMAAEALPLLSGSVEEGG
jgi:mannose/cellobiose epimerase-like protein (N-acyl-D-glucosamine 2-epimerase family)